MTKILDDVFKAAGSKNAVILAALGISAVFDTLDHSTLISCLEYTFGISKVSKVKLKFVWRP